MKIKTVLLIVLALFAFTAATMIHVGASLPKLYNISKSLTDSINSFVRPLGDAVGGGQFPH